ncbi:TPA: hypothetical protein I8190_000999 [Citrobacter freundii]|uniref:hypothetical protein n=1 Tax=Citrobacter TaxID=544 RepID=UPI000B23268B|nr:MULTISPECIES: hypothetical protein [Citrobacter]HAT2284297.1 hypothetical protein [Citrobacter freundii]MBC6536038.1 hypothetical protein [Citrobacter amalonaticus]MCK8152396.1 hypothetical protein [Citrobacter amalonaticus]GJK84128.1 hypothetical protein TUM17567_04230 [Citrobacter amalonaticus]HAT2348291.1 hypothetical protein [Citrobacter freundii]
MQTFHALFNTGMTLKTVIAEGEMKMIDFARQPARIQAVRGNAFTAPLRFLWRILKNGNSAKVANK